MAKISTLIDNFTSGTIDPAKWADWGAAQTNVVSGQLKCETLTTDGYYGINSSANYDITDSSAYIEVPNAGNQALESFECYPLSFALDTEEFGRVEWMISGNTIYALQNTGTVIGDGVQSYTEAYNSTSHRWFRIREASGTLYWETSPDGTTWTTKYSTATLSGHHATSTQLNVFVGTWQSEASASFALFDNLNTLDTGMSLSGTFVMSGGVAMGQEFALQLSGTFTMSGGVVATVSGLIRETITKQYVYKVYDTNGDFLGQWNDVASDFAYSQEINSAGSSIDVTLARTSDSLSGQFNVITTDAGDNIQTDSSDDIAAETATRNSVGPGTTVDLNLNVKVYVFTENDLDTNGRLIFTGYISKYVTRYGSTENTLVTLFSYGADMDNWVLENGSGNTRVPYNTIDTPTITDPGDILKDALDKFNAVGGIPTYGQGTFTTLTNLFTDPDCTAVTGWTGLNTPVTYTSGDGDTTALRVTSGVTSPWIRYQLSGLTIGQPYELFMRIGSNGLPTTVTGGYSEDGTNFITSQAFAGAGNGTWFSCHVTFTPTITNPYIRVISAGSMHDVRVDKVAYGIGLTQYFSGRTEDTEDAHYDWTGTVDASTSTMKVYSEPQTIELPSDYVDGGDYAVSYTFNVNTILEVVKKVLELSPTDWFWWYDMANNYVNLHPRPTTVDHTFVLGKHILSLNLEKYIEDLVNTVYYTGGDIGGGVNLFKKYEDATSIATYRRGVERITDNRVTVPLSAQIISEALIERAKDPRYRSSVQISDQVYDIESIRLGDLVGFRNFGNFVDTITMQVVRIDYQPDYVQLQLDTILPSVPKRLEDIKRNLNQSDVEQNPDAPTP